MLDILTALKRMIKNEPKLIEPSGTKKPGEEVLNHQLARRIAKSNINTDVEYGIDQTKNNDKGQHELGKAIRPDIIVHKRGTNTDNRIVIECKWSDNVTRSRVKWDIFKLLYFRTSPTYSYNESYFVIYRKNSRKEPIQEDLMGNIDDLTTDIINFNNANKDKSIVFKISPPINSYNVFADIGNGINDIKVINISENVSNNVSEGMTSDIYKITYRNQIIYYSPITNTYSDKRPREFTLEVFE